MYNKKDIENASVENRVPDGMSDETDFVKTLQAVADLLKNTDFTSNTGRTVFGLELINLACNEQTDQVEINKAVNVIISMSSHISQLINALSSIENIDIQKYFQNYQETLLDPLVDKPIIPFYENEE
jgi:hypothetical protein